MTANERPNWINAGNRRSNSQLRASASLASNTFDFNGTSFHLWHLLAEQIFDERFVAAAQNQLRATVVALDILDKHLDATTDAIEFTLNLLALWNNSHRFAKLNPYNPRLNALDDTRHDRTDFVFKLCKHNFTLGFTQALQHDLLGRLRGNTPKARHFVLFLDNITELGIRFLLLGVLEADFDRIAAD